MYTDEDDAKGKIGHPESSSDNDRKLSITDLLYGVLARPVETLRYIADRKLVGAGIVVYVVTALLTTIAGLPSAMRQFEEVRELYGIFVADTQVVSIFMVLSAPFSALIGLLIFTGILHLVARLLKGQGEWTGLLSAYGFSNFPTILTVPLGLLAFTGAVGGTIYSLITFPFTIWMLVLQIIAVRENYRFTTGRAIATFLIPALVIFVLGVFLAMIIAILVIGMISG